MNEEKRAKRAMNVKRAKQMHEAGYKVAEIASTLGLNEATVRLYIHICRDEDAKKKKE